MSRGAPATVESAVHYLGQPSQYGVGRGSQLSVLVVFDHGRKEAPPGIIDNYIDRLKPSLHGLADPRYPSLVGCSSSTPTCPSPARGPVAPFKASGWPPARSPIGTVGRLHSCENGATLVNVSAVSRERTAGARCTSARVGAHEIAGRSARLDRRRCARFVHRSRVGVALQIAGYEPVLSAVASPIVGCSCTACSVWGVSVG